MAWNGTYVFVANDILTAAQLNTYTQDNLAQTAPALATNGNKGYGLYSAGLNSVEFALGDKGLVVGGYQALTNSAAWITACSVTLPANSLTTTGRVLLGDLMLAHSRNTTSYHTVEVTLTLGATTLTLSFPHYGISVDILTRLEFGVCLTTGTSAQYAYIQGSTAVSANWTEDTTGALTAAIGARMTTAIASNTLKVMYANLRLT